MEDRVAEEHGVEAGLDPGGDAAAHVEERQDPEHRVADDDDRGDEDVVRHAREEGADRGHRVVEARAAPVGHGHADRQADDHGEDDARADGEQRPRQVLHDVLDHGLARVRERVAEVEGHQALEEVEVLAPHRGVGVVVDDVGRRGHRLVVRHAGGVEAPGHDLDRVARHEVHEQERDGRDQPDHEHGLEDPPEGVGGPDAPEDTGGGAGRRTVRNAGLRRGCGRCGHLGALLRALVRTAARERSRLDPGERGRNKLERLFLVKEATRRDPGHASLETESLSVRPCCDH